MAPETRATTTEAERRQAAERLRGLFADVAPERPLVDELIADRRADDRAESRAAEARLRRRAS